MVRQSDLRPSLKRLALFAVISVFVLTTSVALLQAQGNQLQNRSLTVGSSQASANTTYKFSFQPIGLDTLQTIVLQICSNDPFPGTPCTPPAGFSASDAALISQSGDTGFAISPASTANQIVLTRPPLVSGAVPDSYEFSGIVNPINQGSYYVRIQTFQDANTAGDATNYGGLAYAINSSISITATVPPYLLFCAGVTITGYTCDNVVGNYVDFGEFASNRVSQGTTQLLASSNAKDGYTIRITGTTLTSGNNVITAISAADVSRPGVSQFGLNLRANSSPQGGQDASGVGSGLPFGAYNRINFFSFNDGDIVASTHAPDDARKYTASYIANITKGQAPGVYVSTLTYIALGSY